MLKTGNTAQHGPTTLHNSDQTWESVREIQKCWNKILHICSQYNAIKNIMVLKKNHNIKYSISEYKRSSCDWRAEFHQISYSECSPEVKQSARIGERDNMGVTLFGLYLMSLLTLSPASPAPRDPDHYIDRRWVASTMSTSLSGDIQRVLGSRQVPGAVASLSGDQDLGLRGRRVSQWNNTRGTCSRASHQ